MINWEPPCCSNQACAAGRWLVQRDPASGDPSVELEGRDGEPLGATVAPIFGFVASLA